MLPEAVKKFVEIFASLPSIGPRQATRLAFHIKSLGEDAIRELSLAVASLKSIKTCAQCFFTFSPVGDGNLCHICANPQRQKNIIAVLEKETDLISLEKTKKFGGHYFILGDLKKEGVLDGAQKLRLQSLKARVKNELGGKAKEIILAINPTTYGDLNADIIKQELKDCAEKISRLGRGIPTGGEIEFADEDTLGGALDNRS